MTTQRESCSGLSLAERFGDLYAELTDVNPTAVQLAAQRARLLMRERSERLVAEPSLKRWRLLLLSSHRFLLPATALLTALALAVLAQLWRSEAALTAEWQGHLVTQGTQFSTTAGDQGDLAFSDGSRVLLEADSQGQVLTLKKAHTAMRLHRGSVSADINRATGATWDILAGPYRVSVVGTKFALSWEPETNHFEVGVRQGQVRVDGGSFESEGVSLRAGDSIVLAPKQPEPSIAATERAASDASAEQSQPADTRAEPRPHRPVRVQRAPTAAPVATTAELPAAGGSAPSLSWKELATSGQYEAAFDEAAVIGFSLLLAQEGPAELLLLANTARYSDRSEPARRAFTTLRERHGASPEARIAAYYLARLALDEAGQPRVAVQWLRTYLRETPRGLLASSGRARLIETLLQLGDDAGAQEVAKDYIRLHPKAPYVGVARSLIRESRRPLDP